MLSELQKSMFSWLDRWKCFSYLQSVLRMSWVALRERSNCFQSRRLVESLRSVFIHWKRNCSRRYRWKYNLSICGKWTNLRQKRVPSKLPSAFRNSLMMLSWYRMCLSRIRLRLFLWLRRHLARRRLRTLAMWNLRGLLWKQRSAWSNFLFPIL